MNGSTISKLRLMLMMASQTYETSDVVMDEMVVSLGNGSFDVNPEDETLWCLVGQLHHHLEELIPDISEAFNERVALESKQIRHNERVR